MDKVKEAIAIMMIDQRDKRIRSLERICALLLLAQALSLAYILTR
jgi:hypothetical protein